MLTAKGVMTGNIYIGTSGWVYKGWQKEFYLAELPAKEQFRFYATQFPTVEINATFNRLPMLSMVKGWRDKAPHARNRLESRTRMAV